MITLAVMVIGNFSAFILHDLKRNEDGLETNNITATQKMDSRLRAQQLREHGRARCGDRQECDLVADGSGQSMHVA